MRLTATAIDTISSARRLDLAATVLLAVATVATAWSAYQSRQWMGEQSQGYSHATATRISVNRKAALANRQVQIDLALFIQWIDAHETHRRALADFYAARFRSAFKPAFAAWLATNPFTNRNAPPSRFATPQYRLAAAVASDRLETTAAASSQRAKDANRRADDYMLAVVPFACSLFFAGISAKVNTPTARVVLVSLGWIVFLGTAVRLVTLPVQLTT